MGSSHDGEHVPRACPACDRTWGSDATFCGACGALLDPAAVAPAHPSGGTRPRRGLAIAAVLAVAVVVTLAVPRVELPSFGGNGIEDDDIALPTEAVGPTARTPSASGRGDVSCSRSRVPTDDCFLWRVDGAIGGPGITSLVRAGILLTSGEDATVARDIETGEQRWERDDLGTPVFPLLATDAVIAVFGRDGRVRGLGVTDGTERWSFRGVPLGLDPSRTNGVLPLGVRDAADEDPTGLVGLDADDGVVRWEWAPPWSGPIGSVTITPDAVFATGAGRLARVDAATGRTEWAVDTAADAYLQYHDQGVVTAHGPTGDQSTRAEDDAGLVLHAAATGEVLQRLGATTLMSHVVTAGRLVVHDPSDAAIRGLDLATGDVLWTRPLEGRGSLGMTTDGSPPLVVVMERGADRVSRLDPRSGEPLWQATLPRSAAHAGSSAFLGQPRVAGDRVVVEDENSVVTVLDADDGRELVSLDGGVGLDVRSTQPLVLVHRGDMMAVDVEGPETGQ